MNRFNYLILLGLLSACSGKVPLSQLEPDPGVAQKLQQITSWDLDGRLAVIDGDKSGAVTLHWLQHEEYYRMRFVLPLGQGSYILMSRGGRDIQVGTPGAQTLYGDDAADLAAQVLGWRVPIDAFKYWVRSLPSPDLNIVRQQFDAQGRLEELQQGGWNIYVKRYMQVGGVNLPSKIFIHNRRLKLKLAIFNWGIDI